MHQQANTGKIQITIQRGFFDNSQRQLIISPEYIEFEENNLKSAPFTRFNKNEITELRFGVKWHSGIYFTIGREFEIHLKNKNKQTLKINFNSYLGINKNKLGILYNDLVGKLWTFYFYDITITAINKFQAGEDVKIGDVKISKQGVTIKIDGLISVQEIIIPWNKVGIRNYNTYFAIYSTEDSAGINRGFSYINDWNTMVLRSVVENILINIKDF